MVSWIAQPLMIVTFSSHTFSVVSSFAIIMLRKSDLFALLCVLVSNILLFQFSVSSLLWLGLVCAWYVIMDFYAHMYPFRKFKIARLP